MRYVNDLLARCATKSTIIYNEINIFRKEEKRNTISYRWLRSEYISIFIYRTACRCVTKPRSYHYDERRMVSGEWWMNRSSPIEGERVALRIGHALPPTYSGCVDYGMDLMIASRFGRTLDCGFLRRFLQQRPLADRVRDGITASTGNISFIWHKRTGDVDVSFILMFWYIKPA